MKVLLFRGFRKTGKTTLMERAVRGLSARGYSVAVVKHSPHLHPDRDQNDTARLLRAGGSEALLAGAGVEVSYRRVRSAPGPEELARPPGADFVLIEGFRGYQGALPGIIFGASAQQLRNLRTPSTVACSGTLPDAGRESRALGLPFLPLDAEPELLADFVEGHAAVLRPPA